MLLLVGCNGDDDDASTTTTESTTTTTEPTTTTVDPLEDIEVNDPVSGDVVTFGELIELRDLVEVETSYGTVWLEPIANDPLFPDGVAYMAENCTNVTAQDLLRREQIEALIVVCLEDF